LLFISKIKTVVIMSIRTDLVLEESEKRADINGVLIKNFNNGEVTVTYTEVQSDEAQKALNKKKGKYITLEFKGFTRIADCDEITESLTAALGELLPKKLDNIMLVGLGNSDITPDALGPFVMDKILATRHIKEPLLKQLGLGGLKSVSVITPGVLGKTGIEASELVTYVAQRINPSAIIVVDALAARNPSRLLNTVQLTDSGISPGSGVHNKRRELSRKNMGVPVIAIGVPTVVDISKTQAQNEDFGENMIVTLTDIDKQISEAAGIISRALNIFLQPEIDKDLLLNLV
jgi:spore protease